MQVQRKNSSRLIDRLITYVGFIVFIAMATETAGQDDLNCYGKVDVVFVIDASFSLTTTDFESVCTFANDTYILLNTVLAGSLRSAVIQFATNPYYPFLSLTSDSTAVISYLGNKTRDPSNVGTETGKAMMEAIKVFTDDLDQDAYKAVVVVTDGQPDNRTEVFNALAQLKELGAKVIIVGIGTSLNVPANNDVVIHDDATLSIELVSDVAKDVCKDTATSLPTVDQDDVVMDIVFVMDESHGDATRFDITKRFIMLIMNTFTLSSNYAQVSILNYGKSVLFSEPNYISLRYLELFSAMESLSLNLLNTGGRDYSEVFEALDDEINNYGTAQRPFIVVLFMSGIGDNELEVIDLANRLRDRTNPNVYLLIVATGEMTEQLNTMTAMKVMAYDPALVFQTNDYERLAGSTQESKDFIALVRQNIYDLATGNFESTNTGPVRWSAAVDVMFLIDGSADMQSIPHFAIVKRFILQLVDTFAINPGRVALCVFDNAGVYDTRGYELNYNHEEFQKQLNSMSLIKRTSTADPNQGLDGILKYSDAHRIEGNHQIAYLITLGKTSNEILSGAYARAIAMRGIQLMVIGIGNNVVAEQLQALQMFGGPVTITDLTNIASAEMLLQFNTELQQYANIIRPVGTYFEWSDGFDMLILIHTELAREDGGISLKSAMIDIVQRYSSLNARIGIITFGQEASTKILLSESEMKQMLIIKIVSLTITPSGGPNVLAALNEASQRFTDEGRAGIPHLIMIMFQGDIGSDMTLMNKIMEMKQAGIAINSFGFGPNTDITHTRSLAFHPDTAYSVRQPLEYSVTMDANVIALARNEFVPSQVGNITVLENVCHDKAGIIFLIDISASMTDYFESVKRFLAVLISGFDMTEYGFVPFSTTVADASVVKLGEFDNYVENYLHLMDLEMNAKQLATITSIAINYAKDEFAKSPKYSSDNAPEKIIMIVSDGKSANRQETIKAANASRDAGITILGAGVGEDYDEVELTSVVLDDNNLFNITNDDTLNTETLLRLQSRICRIIRPGDCFAGNYRDESTSACLPCAVGFYQPNDEQLSCIKCQDGFSTSETGATSANDCIQTCDVGEYFMNDCELCPLNTYKDTSGAGPCSSCPADKPITKATGSTSIDACMADVCPITMDLMLVVDASASIDIVDFNLLKVVLLSLVEKFNTEVSGTRVAIATIRSETTENDVSDFSNDTAEISMDIRSMQSGALTTNTASAFKMVRQKVQQAPRSNIPIVVFVITDGLSADPFQTTLEAAVLQQYANIVALGVGQDLFLEELNAITSAPEYVLTASNYLELQNLDISDTICKAADNWEPYIPPAVICDLPMDLMFVMDLSDSASSNLNLMLKMKLDNSLSSLPIGDETVHVGVFSYGEGIDEDLVQVPSYDMAKISSAIWSQAPPDVLSTDTHLAIDLLIELFDDSLRSNALKVAMIFTDGLSTLPDRTRNAAASAKASGIHLIAVGPSEATGAERNELGNISSTGQGGVVYAPGGYFNVTPEQIVEAACPGLSVCNHPIDAVFIWYIANEDERQAQTTQLTGDISARFDMMTAGLIKVSTGTTVDTLAKALSKAANQLLGKSDVIRTIVVMTDQVPSDEVNTTNEVSDLKDDGVIITFITPTDIPEWTQYASSVYTNPNFGNNLVTTKISWSICKAPCLSGYDINDAGNCEECPIGSYRSRTESYQCMECGPEWTTDGPGRTSGADCILITDECLGGFEKLDDGTCSPCPKDMYRERYKQLQCQPCPSGFFTRFSGSESLDNCLPMCDIGRYWSSLTEECKECEIGTYNDVPNQFVCKACHEDGLMVTVDDNRSIVTGATSEDQCVGNCEPGEFWNNTECKLCPENTFQNQPRRDYCASCLPGHISNAVSTAETDCNDPCNSGTTYNFETKTCEPCGLNKYRDKANGDNICQDCPDGLITDTDTAGSVTLCKSDCEPGQWWNTNKLKCFECQTGTYQPDPSSDSCIQCDNGWTSPTGSNSSSNCKPPCTKGEEWDETGKKCVPCPLGTYQDEENQVTCKQCDPTKSTEFKGSTDASQCVEPCTNGKWICTSNTCVSGDSRCNNVDNCDDGSDEEGCDCDPGNFYDEDASECKVCAVGSFQENMGQLTCFECPVGTTTTTTGSVSRTDCKDICDSGYKYVIDGSSFTCEPCEIGEFRKKNRDDPLQCIQCPIPFTTQGTASDDYDQCISKCEPGQYYNVEEKTCTNCLPGYYQDEQFDEYQCVKCPLGSTTDGPGANNSADCKDVCDIGTELPISGTKKDDCVNCSSGSFRGNTMAICDLCANGFTSSPGSDSASDCYPDCKAGQMFNEARTGCQDCSLGSFKATKPTPDQPSCNWCDPGKVTNFTASKLPSDCKDVCNSGLELSEDRTKCVICPIGTYRERFQNDVCTPCPTGTSTLTAGATSLSFCKNPCDPGKSMNSLGTCVACGLNKYRGENDPQCLTCEDNKITYVREATSASLCYPICEPGSFLNTQTSVCQSCSRTEYQDQRGQLECKPCPKDYHNDGTNKADITDCRADWCEDGLKLVGGDPPIGKCVPCGYGFYRGRTDPECVRCPSGLTTSTKTAKEKVECVKEPICERGSFLNTSTFVCQSCSRTEYQDETGKKECKPCPKDYHNDGTNMATETDCRADWCENGLKLVGGDPPIGKCVPCGYGFYRGRTDPECWPCPNGLTTITDTATSEAECQSQVTPGACISGHEPVNGLCVACRYGFYRTHPINIRCVPCPDGYTTHRRGATSADLCILDGTRCSKKFDLVIAIDLSRPSCNFDCVRSLRSWLMDLVYRLDVHADKVRVGIIRYGSGTSTLVDLHNGISSKRLRSLLSRGLNCSPNVKANTHFALRNANDMFRHQSRQSCAKKMLLITANHNACPDEVMEAVNRLKNGNVHVTVISSDASQVEHLASDMNSQFVITDYSTLPQTQQVIRVLC